MNDVVNAAFECLGGFAVLLSIVKTLKDKQVRGVHWGTVVFFTTWGYWNLYYYPSLGQTISGYGALGVALMNTMWIGVFWWHRHG